MKIQKTLHVGQALLLGLLLSVTGCKDDEPIAITLEDLQLQVDENPVVGFGLGTIKSSSPTALVFTIASQTPAGAISINKNTGELSVANADLFDFETNPVITATISADQATNTATVTINVNNVNELTTQNFSVSIDENPTSGQSLGIVQATGDGALSYSIASQTPAGALTINSSTGELTVANAALFDFETNPTITATISVDNSGNVQPLTATINLNNVSELVVYDFDVSLDENPANGLVLGTINAVGDGPLTFTITQSFPTGAVNLNASTGQLTVANSTLFNHEVNSYMEVTISVSNSSGNTQTLTAQIYVLNVREIGDLAFGGVIFSVNASGTEGLVCTISDLNGGNTTTWNNGANISTGATGTAIGTGPSNTSLIVNSQGQGTYAAALCANLTLNNFSDWYLPSIDELGAIYTNRAAINATAVAGGGTTLPITVWSSTEQTGNANNAYIYIFADGQSPTLNAKANVASVRAVRSWTDF
jgi:hypothetical protein